MDNYVSLAAAARVAGYRHRASLFNAVKQGTVPPDCIIYFGGRRFFFLPGFEQWCAHRDARRARRRAP